MKKTFFELAAKGAGLVGLTALLGACATAPGSGVQVGSGSQRTTVDSRGTTVRNGGDQVSVGSNGSWQVTDRDRAGTTSVGQDARGNLCVNDGKGKLKFKLCLPGQAPAKPGAKPAPGPGTAP